MLNICGGCDEDERLPGVRNPRVPRSVPDPDLTALSSTSELIRQERTVSVPIGSVPMTERNQFSLGYSGSRVQ